MLYSLYKLKPVQVEVDAFTQLQLENVILVGAIKKHEGWCSLQEGFCKTEVAASFEYMLK